MNTLDFNVPLVDVNGEPSKDGRTLAQTLSEIIAMETEGKTLKLYGWHKTLQVGSPLELDESDTKDLEKLITEHPKVFVFVKGQLLEIFKTK